MAHTVTSVAPVLCRPRNFEWYWNSAIDPWSSAASNTWTKYTDIENEIIEDARVANKSEVEIDGNYVISLKDKIQFNKLDESKQRPIKRIQLQCNRSNQHLREDRFALPIITPTISSGSSTDSTENDIRIRLFSVRNGPDIANTYSEAFLGNNSSKTFGEIVEEAACGIIAEGMKIDKKYEAHWLAKELRFVKHFGDKSIVETRQVYSTGRPNIPREIGETCVFLYTKESFWYKLLNSTLRDLKNNANRTISKEQVKNFGPFSYLLHQYLVQVCKRNNLTVYRGVSLTEEERQEYISGYTLFHFSSFTSTSLSREKAETFGNTLFIIDLDAEYSYSDMPMKSGADISFLSDFPDEQEVLIWPATSFRRSKYEFDYVKNKHIIYFTATDTAP